MKYTIVGIFEEDYGCEGVPENEEPMCNVLLKDIDGNEKWVKLADSYLTKHDLNEGDTIEL